MRAARALLAIVAAAGAGARAGAPPARAAAPAPAAPAAAARIAVVIGNDTGRPDDVRLRYAETDARRIADILTGVGEMAADSVLLLQGRSADDIRGAIRQAETRLLRAGGDGMLFVYYSGHADAEALHPGSSLLPLGDLEAMLRGSAVATRVLIIDACRSGALTHVKGGQPGGPFELRRPVEPNPRGLAIVTSSAAGEDSQESDELRAAFFTHHLASALAGAADADRDGAVTLAEAFSYAARHTTGSTAATWAGPQHPTYRVDLGGREDLVLTRPAFATGRGAGLGHLALAEPGSYFIRREGEAALTAELSGDAVDRPLALPAGRYEIIQRASDHLFTGTFTVAPAATTAVTTSGMRRVDFGRAVRKGSTARVRAVSLHAGGGLRGSLLGLGAATCVALGARLDLQRLSFTGALDLAAGSFDGTRGTRLATSELALRAGALRALDASRFTVALGAELGLSRFGQAASDRPMSRHSYAASAAPVAIIEAPVGHRFFISLQASLPAYLLTVESDDHLSERRSLRLTYRIVAAVGGYL